MKGGVKMENKVVKLSMSMSEELLIRLDAQARKFGTTRSATASVLISQALDFNDTLSFMDKLPDIMASLEKLSNDGNITLRRATR
jgi:hypothetical protein